MTTATESPTEALGRIQNGFSKNDAIVIAAFAAVGIPADRIEPRRNVLTFHAWRALGRRVAKGATSLAIQTWIPIGPKADDPTDETPADPDAKPARSAMRPKTARLFHIDQTIAAKAPKGTRPAAWDNAKLVKEGTYENFPIASAHLGAGLAEAFPMPGTFKHNQDGSIEPPIVRKTTTANLFENDDTPMIDDNRPTDDPDCRDWIENGAGIDDGGCWAAERLGPA